MLAYTVSDDTLSGTAEDVALDSDLHKDPEAAVRVKESFLTTEL